MIFIDTLIQKMKEFDRAPTIGEVGKLVIVYTILPDEKDLKEPKGILKFTKASGWISPITSKKPIVIKSKTPDSETSP